MADLKHFRLEKIDDVVVLRLVDTELFDRLIISEMREEIESFLQDKEIPRLLVNFCEVHSLSTETINAMLRARELVVGNGGTFKLCEMRERVREPFKITGLDGTMFEIHESMHQALDSFEDSPAKRA